MVVLLAVLILAITAMVRNPDATELIRDIVIVLVAGETLILGIVLVTLIVQLARLSALLENELRPMLESTNETLGTLRGTSQFLSKNMVQPVMKANSSVAAVRRALGLFRVGRNN